MVLGVIRESLENDQSERLTLNSERVLSSGCSDFISQLEERRVLACIADDCVCVCVC